MDRTYNTTFLKNVIHEIIKAQDIFTFSHLNRVSNLAFKTAKSLQPMHQFSDRHVELISVYSSFHDIGKIGIPCNILNAPREFTEEERRIVQRHSIVGYEIIENIECRFEDDLIENNRLLKNIIIQHHEYLDGSGYPYGITDDVITTEARIVTICDIYDAMTSHRVYKRTYSHDETLVALDTMAKRGKLDKDIFEVFAQTIRE